MKQRLTKEQATWLIEMLDMYHIHTDCTLICEACEIKYGEVKRVIKECTEREFPKFEMLIKRADGICVGTLRLVCHPYGVLIDTPEDNFVLPSEEFKKFTRACVIISEWLEEQE